MLDDCVEFYNKFNGIGFVLKRLFIYGLEMIAKVYVTSQVTNIA